MSVMIDADKAIELLEALYRDSETLYRDWLDFGSIGYNIGVEAAINEIRRLKEEAEQEEEG